MKTVFMRVRNIGKSNNKSAIAASAYRSGTQMYDATKDKMYNYSNKKEVVYDTIMLPPNAPEKYQDKQTLWQTVQDNETASDARYCKDIMIAIPRNLTQEQRVELVNQFLFENFVTKGYICQISIHDKGDGNPHAHILVSARPLNTKGQWATVKAKRVYKLDAQGNKIPIIDKITGQQKIGARGRKMWQREWAYQDPLDQASSLSKWKKSWRDICNEVLDKEHQLQVGPEGKHATIHLGPQAAGLEKKGIKTRIGEKNRQIKIANRKADLQAALLSVDKKIQEEQELIKKEHEAIERLKELANKSEYRMGWEIQNYYNLLYAKVQYEKNYYKKELEYYQNYKWLNEKQLWIKAVNILTNNRVYNLRKKKKQLEKDEENLQKKRDNGDDIYDDLQLLKKHKKELEDENQALKYFSNEPANKDKIKQKFYELAEKQNAKAKRYDEVYKIVPEYEKLEKRLIAEYKKIQYNEAYELYATKSKEIKWSQSTGSGPDKIANDLNKILAAMKPQTPEPQLHNNLKADLSKGKDIDDDYEYDYSY